MASHNRRQTSASKGPDGPQAITLILSLGIPLILVAAFLLLILGLRGRLEASVSLVAGWLPVGYAVAAGMVASVNPCGVLMLPSYIFFQLGTEAEQAASTWRRILKALRLAAATTAGFGLVIGLVGGLVSLGGRWLVGLFPVGGVLIGLVMIGLGIWLLISEQGLGLLIASRVTVTPERSLANVFLFGVAYAVTSLSCTLPILLAVVGSALAGGDWPTSLAQFAGYVLGMGLVMAAVTVGTSLFRRAVEQSLRRIVPHVHRVSALFLVGAGLYLVYHWVFGVDLGGW